MDTLQVRKTLFLRFSKYYIALNYINYIIQCTLFNAMSYVHSLGVSDDREGLFDTIHRSKSHSHKRGYQCIKCIVQLTQT